MVLRGGHRTGWLGLQLAMAFVAVAITAVGATILIAAVTLGGDERDILNLGYQRQTSAVASDAGAVYRAHGWGQALAPVPAGRERPSRSEARPAPSSGHRPDSPASTPSWWNAPR